MEVQRYVGLDQQFDPHRLEEIILLIGDRFEIRIAWDREKAIVTGVCAVVGGLIGSYAGGRLGAAVGAGIAGAAGYGVATMVSLRELWATIKNQLQELLYIVYNFLRRLDPLDIVEAFQMLMACRARRDELVYTIIEFIAMKLGREVLSSIAAA